MSSSATGSTRADAGDGEGAAAAELERTVERLNQGIVVTYELRSEAEDAVAVDLQQSLPPELAVADVGFRTDAAPAEWSVEEDTVRGSGTVPDEGSVEYVLGLKLPEAPDELPTFPEPDLTDGTAGESEGTADERTGDDGASDGPTPDEGAGDDATTDDGAGDDGETMDPPEIELAGTGEPDLGGAGDESSDADASTDGPSLVGNTDGALAESVREVIGGSAADEGPGDTGEPSASGADDTSTGATATDGGPEAGGAAADLEQGPEPRQNPTTSDGLEAAVAAVEPELENGEGGSQEGDEASTDEPPELDLSVPEVGDGMAETGGTETDTDGTGTDRDAGTPGGESGRAPARSGEGGEPTTGVPTETAAPAPDIESLADRLAAADEADRRTVREALGVDDVGGDGASGTVTVRLEKLESRLSAFEAYEDALAAFIDETGTVEEIEATATEAAEAATDLRTDVTALREEVEAAREAAAAAERERTALREDLDALRQDVDEALGLREQLLGALQSAGGAAGTRATTPGGGDQSPDTPE
ncbi:hypothetical protein [Haloglomus litoreum]|uniref:hypothetical protein n=1 Tax=Haloglomus litoreum TaxID=3034026 RepID=UPI0023E7887C|nr:hypothetical protein [Haloglomus sp. DT116]